jgi:hypothetical protein
MTLFIFHEGMNVEFIDAEMVGGPLDGQYRLFHRINGTLPFYYAWFPDGVRAAIYRPVQTDLDAAIAFRFERYVAVTELSAVPD